MIYFVRAGVFGPIKIGCTDDVPKRMMELQSGCPEALILLGTAPGGFEKEKALHQELSQFRCLNEWFWPFPQVIAALRRETGEPTPSPVRAVLGLDATPNARRVAKYIAGKGGRISVGEYIRTFVPGAASYFLNGGQQKINQLMLDSAGLIRMDRPKGQGHEGNIFLVVDS